MAVGIHVLLLHDSNKAALWSAGKWLQVTHHHRHDADLGCRPTKSLLGYRSLYSHSQLTWQDIGSCAYLAGGIRVLLMHDSQLPCGSEEHACKAYITIAMLIHNAAEHALGPRPSVSDKACSLPSRTATMNVSDVVCGILLVPWAAWYHAAYLPVSLLCIVVIFESTLAHRACYLCKSGRQVLPCCSPCMAEPNNPAVCCNPRLCFRTGSVIHHGCALWLSDLQSRYGNYGYQCNT